MNYDKIQAALETRLSSVVGIPELAYPNTKYDPKTDVPFVQVRFIPTSRTNKVLGVDATNKPFWQEYHGIFNLVINMPEGTGTKETNTLVNAICDRYEATTDILFDGISVTIKKVESARGINETPWFKTPVNIYWYSQSK